MTRPDRSGWRPSLGAWPEDRGFRFRVWAPERRRVDLVLDPGSPSERRVGLAARQDGTFVGEREDVRAGDSYAYLLDWEGPYPDPASRSQPGGVHGASSLVDPRGFTWSDRRWPGLRWPPAVVYELHIGTFTAEGTFAAAAARLAALADLGVTAIELMPLADFPGARNWGYDGVSLFAPAHSYGPPDDLRRLVDTAHSLGLGVLLDVVYNHFGPDGAYLTQFSPFYVSTRHHSPWGPAVNLDGDHADQVRAFFVENANHWIHEYHFDGLRLDATHALVDDSPVHFMASLSVALRQAAADRPVVLVAEDDRNLAAIVKPVDEGGWGFDAVWADDFHHQVRRLTAGDRDGYFADYSGTTADLATTIRRGWFFCGQPSAYQSRPRGSDPTGIPVERMVVCLQNHDQVGNRAFGDRLNRQIDGAVYRALAALLLVAPETPLLFMGQEWAASTPFLYFTDHHAGLGDLVRDGRRAEFARFSAFADPAARAQIPDPQATATFLASRLRWEERDRSPHAGVLALYRALLHLRRSEPALAAGGAFDVAAAGPDAIVLERRAASGETMRLVVRLRGTGPVSPQPWRPADRRSWDVVLTTEDQAFLDPAERDRSRPPRLEPGSDGTVIVFARPSAILLRLA
jgi:maltooligosyltrehalose trehalohydrolase